MYSGSHILVFLAFCNAHYYNVIVGLHLFGGLIKKRIFCCYRFACVYIRASFLFLKRWQEKLFMFSSSIMWTRDSRYGFWCLPIDILLQRSDAAFLSIHANRFSKNFLCSYSMIILLDMIIEIGTYL